MRRTALPEALSPLLLALSSGALLVLAFPPFGLWPLAWIALIPWFLMLRRDRGLQPHFHASSQNSSCLERRGVLLHRKWGCCPPLPRFARSLWCSFLAGFVFFGGLLSWIGLFGRSVWAMLAGFEALSFVLAALLLRPIWRLRGVPRLVGCAAVWTGVEWLRGQSAFGLPWGWLGYSQARFLPIAQMASWSSVLGLSFLIALVNAALADLLWEYRLIPPLGRPARGLAPGRRGGVGGEVIRSAGAIVLAGGLALAGALAMRAPKPASALPVALIQGSIEKQLSVRDVNRALSPAEMRREVAVYRDLTRQAIRAGRPKLVIWPESALPGILNEEPWIEQTVGALAAEGDCWLLAGGHYLDRNDRVLNSAFLFGPEGKLAGRYDKLHLVPFGEYVPGRSWLPFLRYYNVRTFDFYPGDRPALLAAGGAKLGVAICFESIFPDIAAAERANGAQLLAVITNDAWFGETAGPEQHAEMAVFRAIENRAWVLRAASSGVSLIIDPTGRTIARAELGDRKAILARVAPTAPNALRPRLVTWLPRLLALLGLVCVVYGVAVGISARSKRC